MKWSQNLKRLNISDNNFGNNGAKILSQAFAEFNEKIITKVGYESEKK